MAGITHEEFANKNGVNVGTFRKWLYQLRNEKLDESSPQFLELTGYSPPTHPRNGARFILGQ